MAGIPTVPRKDQMDHVPVIPAHSIRSFRKGRRVAAADLAAELEVDEWTIARWECGGALPSPEQSAKLIQVLRIPSDRWTPPDPATNGVHARRKLTESDVLEIRRGLALGTSGEQLAKRFGVDRAIISRIKSRRNYNWLQDDGSVLKRRELAWREVVAIRRDLASGKTPEEIAKTMMTSPRQIEEIRDGTKYAYMRRREGKKKPRGKPYASGGADPRHEARRKLTPDEAIEIKQSIDVGYSDRELGRIYRVNQSTIWHIRKGLTWRHAGDGTRP